jgi:hypothetical protein
METPGNRSQTLLFTDFMNHPAKSLHLHIHKVDGSLETFAQREAGPADRILSEFQRGRIFNQEKITIAGDNSLASFTVHQVTRIDLITDLLSVWDFPFVIGALVELTEMEFREFLHDRQRRAQPCTSGDYPVFLEIEMVNGQHSFLWMEIIAGLPADRLLKIYSLLKARSLIFGLRSGGIGILNLANMVRFSIHPDLLAGPAKARPAHQTNGSQPDLFAGSLRGSVEVQPLSHIPQNRRTNFTPSRNNQNENESKMERKHQ